MPEPYRLAIFDFDGTLADSFALFSEAYNQLARRHGFREVHGDEARRLRSLHAREIMREVRMPAWKLPIVSAEYIGIMRERRREVGLFPGTAEMLQSLHAAGITVAIVSSNAEDNVRAVLGEAAGLPSHYACGMSIFGKRSHLRQAIKAAKAPVSAAIYIGDQAADLDAARAEGIDFGAVAWGFGDEGHLAALHPTILFRRPDDIPAALVSPPTAAR
jgi:phosphoglycolate phosphatase